jgi:hypothetical protein
VAEREGAEREEEGKEVAGKGEAGKEAAGKEATREGAERVEAREEVGTGQERATGVVAWEEVEERRGREGKAAGRRGWRKVEAVASNWEEVVAEAARAEARAGSDVACRFWGAR